MKNLLFIAISMAFFANNATAQTLHGVVTDGEKAIPFANVYWKGTTKGTQTDTNGHFQIEIHPQIKQLIVSSVGFVPDTIVVNDTKDHLHVELKSSILQTVEVVHRQKATEFSTVEPINTQTMTRKELLKAACCNLSESFETNPSIDVSFTDAITGTRQIQLLGLAGSYTQILQEGIPTSRGLAQVHGLSYTSGTWVNAIHITKGAGSVVNSYESMAGQINIDLKKPEQSEKLYLNGYLNQVARTEFNLNTTQKISEKWATTTMFHTNIRPMMFDNNNDSFLDDATGYQVAALNRWKFSDNKKWEGQGGIKILTENRLAGQVHFKLEQRNELHPKNYGVGMQTNRVEAWTKTGYVFPNAVYKSIGLQLSGIYHQERNYFGLTNYNATQQTFYANLLYQSIIGNSNHQIYVGASLLADDFQEEVKLWHNTETWVLPRTEIVPGTFVEYTWKPSHRFTWVNGLRADYHNLFGAFVTPRTHLRYEITENTVLRASAGRGQRTASVFADNKGFMASSRVWQFNSNVQQAAYGLRPEISWNYGTSLTHQFKLNYREGVISADFYRTDFQQQVVADLDVHPQRVVISNLQGISYANSFQVQLDYELVKFLDIRLAYRWYDVKTNYSVGLLEKPLLARHRAFLNVAYETKNKWKFDYTLHGYGAKRLPTTAANPEQYRLGNYSPAFMLMNAHISKSFNRWEWYIGGENLTNFTQPNPILAADSPFGTHFDSAIIWAPIFGRMIYVGFRYTIP